MHKLRTFSCSFYLFRVGGCPLNCSNRGDCIKDVCKCKKGFTGEGCEIEFCPKNCSSHGFCANDKCVCSIGYIGKLIYSKHLFIEI